MGASIAALQCRIGVTVIGCGMRGLLGEVLQFSKESNVEVTGVCDIWKQQLMKNWFDCMRSPAAGGAD
jgi:hypothetical protein